MSYMLTKIHFNPRYLGLLNQESKDVVAQLNRENVKKRRYTSYPCFVPIDKIETHEEDGSMVSVYFNSTYISLHEVANTMAFLESKVQAKNILFVERKIERPNWHVSSHENFIILSLPKTDLSLIQYGWGCRIATNKKTKKHLKKSVYDWIIRGWSFSQDSAIFKHAYASLLDLMGHRSGIIYRFMDSTFDIIRKLPTLLEKFGQETNMKFVWETHMMQNYGKDDNPFLQSLTAFLIPWYSSDHSNGKITKEGVNILLRIPYAPNEIKEFLLERDSHMCADKEHYVLTCRACPSMYDFVYSFLLSDRLSGRLALKLFMSIKYNERGTTIRNIGRKREYCKTNNRLIRTNKKIYEVEKMYSRQNVIVHTNKMNGMCHLAKLILLCEMRQNYKSHLWKSATCTPEEYFRYQCVNDYWEFILEMVQNDAVYEPVVPLPKDIKHKGKYNLFVKDSFPVFRFINGIKCDINKINIERYYS